MAGHKTLLDAVKAGDVQILEISRSEAREIEGLSGATHETDDAFGLAIDQAQGEADEAGKSTFVVIQINGGEI